MAKKGWVLLKGTAQKGSAFFDAQILLMTQWRWQVMNTSALEIRNCINACVMVCEYGSTKNGYYPKNILKLRKNGNIDLDIFLRIKAYEKKAEAKVYVKIAIFDEPNNKKNNSYRSAVIEEFSIKYLSEIASDLLPEGDTILPGDPYSFRGLLTLSLQDMNIGGRGRYAAVVDTKTVTGQNVLLDAFYFEVK